MDLVTCNILIWALCLVYITYNYFNIGFTILLISMFFPYKVIDILFGSNINVLADIPYFILFILVVRSVTQNKKNIRYFINTLPKNIKRIILLIIIIVVISSILNKVNILDFLFYFRWIFALFGFMFIVLVNKITIEKAFRIIITIGLFQFPIVFFQRFIMVAIWKISMGDIVRGVFPLYYELVFFQICCILIMIFCKIKKIRIIKYFTSNTIILILLSTLILSNSKSAWIYLILTGVYLISKINLSKVKKIQLLITSGVIILVCILSFNFILNSWTLNRNLSRLDGNKTFQYLWNPKYIYNYFFLFNTTDHVRSVERNIFSTDERIKYRGYNRHVINHLGRGGEIFFNILRVSHSKATLAFGLGPPPMLMSEEKFAESKRFHIIGGPVYVRVLGALGILGVIMIIIFTMFMYTWKNNYDRFGINLSILYKSIVFLIFLLMIYYGVWFSMYTCMILSIILYCSRFNTSTINNQHNYTLEM